MPSAKKIVVALILLAVIVGAFWYGAKTFVSPGGAKPPKSYLKTPVEKIDQKALTLMTRSMAEWEELGKKHGKYRNPETGEYTMVDVCRCQVCGQKIPVPDASLLSKSTKRSSGPDEEDPAAVHAVTFNCPRCGAVTEAGPPL